MTLSKRLDRLETMLTPAKQLEPLIVYFCADEATQEKDQQKAGAKSGPLASIPAHCRPTPEEIEAARQKSIITGQQEVIFCKPNEFKP
ncbi:MAG TPA: hypothetical protein PKN87_09975 [Syntrophomonadaceae bacterium]|nr:hypothetical protein [Syntrophomonadaceae bacterium]HPR92945.1 hypothetical protein [Syntrophomonadaceae bacterium]